MDELLKIDIYELLNISITAEEKEIKSAYRKQALKCHPDKNPDDPKAAELFQQLSNALAILTDSKAREAYDKVLRAKKAAAIRNRELDSKRKKLKEDLEAREKAAREEKNSEEDASRNLEREVERLRAEGYKWLEQIIDYLRQDILEEAESEKADQVVPDKVKIELPRLKIKWAVAKGTEEKNGYSDEELKTILQQHGHVSCLVISKTLKGCAIAEFSDSKTAESVMKFETGRSDNPLKFSWISGKPTTSNESVNIQNSFVGSAPPIPDKSSTITFRDYESVVMMKMRQAEERKRMIQQIKDEEDES